MHTIGILLVTFGVLIVEQPPTSAERQPRWLVEHLVTDMSRLKAFEHLDYTKVTDRINQSNEEQVDILCKFYCATRSKAKKDIDSDAEGPVVDDGWFQVRSYYDQLVRMEKKYLAQVIYASVPGWCANGGYDAPTFYYGNCTYWGSCIDPVLSGQFATHLRTNVTNSNEVSDYLSERYGSDYNTQVKLRLDAMRPSKPKPKHYDDPFLPLPKQSVKSASDDFVPIIHRRPARSAPRSYRDKAQEF